MLSYCSRLCLDIMSTQRLLCSDIWAICTENVRCPNVISSSGLYDTFMHLCVCLFYRSDLVCEIALSAVQTVAIDKDGGRKEIDIKRYARVEMIPGGTIEDSEVLCGVMLNKDVTHPRMKRYMYSSLLGEYSFFSFVSMHHILDLLYYTCRRIENPRIVLLDCSLEYKKGESQVSADYK